MSDKHKEDKPNISVTGNTDSDYKLWQSLNLIYLLISLIIWEWYYYFDKRYKIANLNNFMNRIKKDTETILRSLKIQPFENLVDERVQAMHRVMKYFSDEPTEKINAFLDQIEKDNGK